MTIENGNIIIDFEKLTLDEVAVMLGEMLQRGDKCYGNFREYV